MTVTLPPLRGATVVRLHPLRIRPDGDEYCVGRIATGSFIAVPSVAIDALRLLGQGLSIADAQEQVRLTQGRDIDLADFVASLVDLGYIASIDDQPVTGPAPIRPTLPWLRPAHVRWTLSPAAALTAIALPLIAALTAVLARTPWPTYHDLLWSEHGGIVLIGGAAIGWSMVLLHELGHIVTARAADVPARMSFGTRLQFLVVQTDVTGVWAATRRVRLTVYLAGVAVTVAIASCALLARTIVGVDGLAGRMLGGICLTAIMNLLFELAVFMRTDLYYVLQDLAGCRNLYADGNAYTIYWLRRWRRTLNQAAPPRDPTTALPPAQRRAVRAYTVLLVIGTGAALVVAVAVTIPFTATLLVNGVMDIATGASTIQRLDGLATVAVTGVVVVAWTRAWWRRHSPRIRRWLPGFRRPPRPSQGAEGG